MATIFTQTDAAPGTGGITPEKLRVSTLTKERADNFNTYRMFEDLDAPIEKVHVSETQQKGYMHRVIHPLFNTNFGVSANLNYQEFMNSPLIDAPEIRKRMHERDACSVKDLVEMSGKYGRIVYSYADFMYCKYLGRTSNNYLITLRRFPYGCGDHIGIFDPNSKAEQDLQGHRNDIGRMVTWLGTPGNDMSNILKYSLAMPFEEISAKIENVDGGGEGGGLLGNLMNLTNPTYKQQVLEGGYGETSIRAMQGALGRFGKAGNFAASITDAPPDRGYKDLQTFVDRTKPYGPVDVIAKTHKRKGSGDEGGGITFEHGIQLQFDYQLRSYDGINGRAAMLDLLGNILATTFVNATFWGGGYRMTGASQSNAFANLPIFKLKSNNLSMGSLYSAFTESLTSVGGTFNNGNKIESPGDMLTAMKNILGGLGNMFAGAMINKLGRPQRYAVSSLLSDAPVGMWHLMIGNPKHPILTIGNLIIDKAEIEHYGNLDINGFPTGLKVTVTLKHGKPRDNQLIEQMYMGGDYRVYMPMVGYVNDLWKTAASVKGSSTVTTESSTKQGDSATTVENAKSAANTTKRASEQQENVQTESETKVSSEAMLSWQLRSTGMDNQLEIARAAEEAWHGSEERQQKTGKDANTEKKEDTQ